MGVWRRFPLGQLAFWWLTTSGSVATAKLDCCSEVCDGHVVPSRLGSVHVATTRRHYKGKVYEAHLLRRSYRENGKVKNQTLGNISHLPPDRIAIIRRRLAGEKFVPGQDLQIRRSLPHGHVLAVSQTMRQLGMAELLDHTGSRQRDVALALICARVVEPRSKLATAGDHLKLPRPDH